MWQPRRADHLLLPAWSTEAGDVEGWVAMMS